MVMTRKSATTDPMPSNDWACAIKPISDYSPSWVYHFEVIQGSCTKKFQLSRSGRLYIARNNRYSSSEFSLPAPILREKFPAFPNSGRESQCRSVDHR